MNDALADLYVSLAYDRHQKSRGWFFLGNEQECFYCLLIAEDYLAQASQIQHCQALGVCQMHPRPCAGCVTKPIKTTLKPVLELV